MAAGLGYLPAAVKGHSRPHAVLQVTAVKGYQRENLPLGETPLLWMGLGGCMGEEGIGGGG